MSVLPDGSSRFSRGRHSIVKYLSSHFISLPSQYILSVSCILLLKCQFLQTHLPRATSQRDSGKFFSWLAHNS